jgi:ribonucleotide monophosphatase NagD (HAD superfamily)
MEKLQINSKESLMIGDNYNADANFAQAAGIRQVIIIDRLQVEDMRCDKNGVIFVNSLKHVITIIRKFKE